MKTVHIVFNAHIDPIWLWPWQSGLDEVLATCRSACDRLDAHPDVTFTRGEAWVYDEIERIDPALFARIRRHVEAGRWEVVGGWWLQPDCNLPSGFAMERQIALGREYFESRFGAFPRVAYNVDSFGHAATLPGLMHACGQDRYVMMRPQPWEMDLPACLFRWRGYEGGPEVVTFRIVSQYNLGTDLNEGRMRAALEQLPEGVNDTMLFAGFGDHGGGPTERQIRWFSEHQTRFEGVRLVFSSPTRFFDAVWPQRDLLPLVTGELQQHAIGCYSAYRPIKTAVRQAEHLLRQAEVFCDAEPASTPADAGAQISEAWKRVCFNHFHDTLGGTCLPSAYAQPLAQLGYAQNVADALLHEGLRRRTVALPDDPCQRVVLLNASDLPYGGPVEFTPWLDWQKWGADWRLVDEDGATVPVQTLAPEALWGDTPNLLFPVQIAPRGLRVLRIQYEGGAPGLPPRVVATPEALSAQDGSVRLSASSLAFGVGVTLSVPELMLYEDASDTWSHNLDRYGEQPLARASWDAAEIVDHGPLMASWIRAGSVGDSRLTAEWRVYGEGFAELRLAVDWRERHKLLKLVQPLAGPPVRRSDGILGGWLARPFDGRELPLRDGMIIEGDGGTVFGIVAPDVYAADATSDRVRFTLLRSPAMSHHIPGTGQGPRRTFTDQGEHVFTFRFFGGPSVTPDLIDRHASQMQRPPIIADLTRGMPLRLYDQPVQNSGEDAE